MLEFDFQSIEQTQRVEFAKMARRLPGNRASVEFIVKHIGVRVTTTRNDSYFVDAFNYLCAHLFARANMPNEAAEAIAASKVLPYSEGDVLFHDAVADSIALAHAQDEAIKRGAPAITLASMPRAASAALTQTLARITGAPIFRVSIGEFPNYWLMPAWLKRLTPGGAILQDHFGASKFNLLELHSHGIKSVFVLVRDPRAAAMSYAKWECSGQPTEGIIEEVYLKYVSWLRDWLEAERSGKITVRWIRSRDVTHDSTSLKSVLTTMLGPSRFADRISNASLAVANVTGERSEAWRESVSPQLRDKMWRLYTFRGRRPAATTSIEQYLKAARTLDLVIKRDMLLIADE
jgi:hypothetical protein